MGTTRGDLRPLTTGSRDERAPCSRMTARNTACPGEGAPSRRCRSSSRMPAPLLSNRRSRSSISYTPSRSCGSLGPAKDTLLLATPLRYPPIAELARPMLRLGGVRIDPQNNAVHHAQTFVDLRLVRIADGRETAVALPDRARVGLVFLEPGRRALRVHARDGARGAALRRERRTRGAPGGSSASRSTPCSGIRSAGCPTGGRSFVRVIPPDRGGPPPPPAGAARTRRAGDARRRRTVGVRSPISWRTVKTRRSSPITRPRATRSSRAAAGPCAI